MKHLTKYTSAILMMILTALPLSAKNLSSSNSSSSSSKITNSLIVANLLTGMKSSNEGLKLSSLYLMGNYDTEKSVIELLRTLKDDPKDEARITAALSLYKLGDARGIYAVKRAAEFDESPRVRKMCENYYRQYLAAKFN